MIVGLANPGAEYAQTRHNAGAWYVDLLAQRHNQQLKEESKFFGYTARLNLAGNDVRLLVPTTFMNLSGKAVLAMANFYRIEPSEILVAHDELDFPRLKRRGGIRQLEPEALQIGLLQVVAAAIAVGQAIEGGHASARPSTFDCGDEPGALVRFKAPLVERVPPQLFESHGGVFLVGLWA